MTLAEICLHLTGVDPGFFLGRGVTLKNGVADWQHIFFAEY